MAFLKGVKETITVPVTAVCGSPGEDPIEVKFRATFKNNMSPKKVIQYAEKIRKSEAYPEDPIRESLVGWSELYGADDQEVEFSQEALEEMMNSLPYVEALFDGWVQANSNPVAAKQKNS